MASHEPSGLAIAINGFVGMALTTALLFLQALWFFSRVHL